MLPRQALDPNMSETVYMLFLYCHSCYEASERVSSWLKMAETGSETTLP